MQTFLSELAGLLVGPLEAALAFVEERAAAAPDAACASQLRRLARELPELRRRAVALYPTSTREERELALTVTWRLVRDEVPPA